VSHAGPDSGAIDEIFTEGLRSKYSPYMVFQYNSRGPAKEHYKQVVLLAMSYSKCAVWYAAQGLRGTIGWAQRWIGSWITGDPFFCCVLTTLHLRRFIRPLGGSGV
jgi:hypothetical protein